MVAREGRFTILALLVLTVTTAVIGGWPAAVPVVLITLVLLYIFRDPVRQVPASPLAVVSPVDGRVVTVDEVHDPYLDRQVKRISIRINASGSYGVRSPVEGKLLRQWLYRHNGPAEGSQPDYPHTIYTGRHFVMYLQTDEHDDVVMVVRIASFQRPRCYVNVGERLGQGQRCGWLLFGGAVDLLLPEWSRPAVTPGTHVSAGSVIIANLVH